MPNITTINTTPTLLNFATDLNADVEPDPDSERLVPYEPGYVDGKDPLHEAAVRRILSANPGHFLRRSVAVLPTLFAHQVLTTISLRTR